MGIPRQTLESKIKALRIDKLSYQRRDDRRSAVVDRSLEDGARQPPLGENAREDQGHEVIQRRPVLLDLHAQYCPFK